MVSNLWRFMVALLDIRAWARWLTGRPEVDVVFITNLRDEAERQRFFGTGRPSQGHANGPRMYLNGVAGRVRGIYVTAEEMLTKEGRRLAKEQFLAATAWAESKGARVVLLAASTKRLFGRDGAELKQRFPSLLFTIGDNGTAHMLNADVFRALDRAGLPLSLARVLVIGPYGILGKRVTEALVNAGCKVLGYGANQSALRDVAAQFAIPVMSSLKGLENIDAVVACTHSAAVKLSAHDVQQLRRRRRKLLVVDVAEPANFDTVAYGACQFDVVRQDAGNAYSPRLHYVLGRYSWRLLMLSEGVVFGCFAEAMSLFHAIYQRGQVKLAERDWFAVNPEQTEEVSIAFAHMGFTVPEPRCFGEPVYDYQLAMKYQPGAAEHLGMRWVYQSPQ